MKTRMYRRKLGVTFGLLIAALLAYARSADGAIVNNNDLLDGTGYEISGIDVKGSVDFVKHAADATNRSTIGTLTLTPNHGTFTWLGFTLTQTGKAKATSEPDEGLRLLFNVSDKNMMTKIDWVDYHIRAANDPYNDVDADGAHRGVAHFHATGKGTNAKFVSSPLVGFGDNVKQLDFGLGKAVPPGDTFTATNIVLHERDFINVARTFRIETIPSMVPEPTTFVLAALGMPALLVCAWRRRTRERGIIGTILRSG